nr:MAG TPA: hypothetical protein [Caudoviricetes sp.]
MWFDYIISNSCLSISIYVLFFYSFYNTNSCMLLIYNLFRSIIEV